MPRKLLYLSENRQATWLELFFDLIFVVSIGRITHFLSPTHHGHLEPGAWWLFILTFIPLWWIWVGHTVYSNRFDEDTRPHRVITLFIMYLLILMSVILGDDIIKNYRLFIVLYGAIRLCLAGMLFLVSKKYPDRETGAFKIGLFFTIGALISTSAFFFELPMAAMIFYGGLLFDILARIFLYKYIKALPVHKHHLVERVGLLAIILLGESIISMSGSLVNVEWFGLTIATASCGFLILCMLWWIYFDSFVLLIESKKDVNCNAIIYSQLFTYMSLGILANTIRHAILNDLNIVEFRVMAIVGMMLLYGGKQTAYFFNVPEYRKYLILNTCYMFAIVGLSLLLPQPQYILMGMAFSMMVYIWLNYIDQIKLYGRVHL